MSFYLILEFCNLPPNMKQFSSTLIPKRIEHGESISLKCDQYIETITCNFGELKPSLNCLRQNGKKQIFRLFL